MIKSFNIFIIIIHQRQRLMSFPWHNLHTYKTQFLPFINATSMQFAHMVCPHTLKLNTRLGFRNLELMHRTHASSSMVGNSVFSSTIGIPTTACGLVVLKGKELPSMPRSRCPLDKRETKNINIQRKYYNQLTRL